MATFYHWQRPLVDSPNRREEVGAEFELEPLGLRLAVHLLVGLRLAAHFLAVAGERSRAALRTGFGVDWLLEGLDC